VGSVERASVKVPGIEVRHCRGLAEYELCVELERQTWGEAILVPAGLFVVAIETGGQVLGAFSGGRLIGFTMALAGMHAARPFIHSHMTAVVPEFRDRGVGRTLKLKQREDALERGFELVEWTFDPLELKNAHFNLVRLGAIVRRFIPNCYGITHAPLHGDLPTDRLVAEWWLRSPRVEAILAGKRPSTGKNAERVRVPVNIGEIKSGDPEGAARIQRVLREEFQRRLQSGYAVTGIEHTNEWDEYVLEPVKEIEALGRIGLAGH
jgi:predicted GNAT superfamily acetyltransferase